MSEGSNKRMEKTASVVEMLTSPEETVKGRGSFEFTRNRASPLESRAIRTA
jgi:hypothetical protein